MTIGVDLDEVLADFLSAVIKYHNAVYGTTLTRQQFHSYNFWEVWGGTKDQAIQKVYDFYRTPFARQIKTIAGAPAGVAALKNNHDLVIITSRQQAMATATYDWLNEHFYDCFKGVHFTNQFAQTGPAISKAQLCDRLNVDALIEDVAQYARDCLTPQRQILLLNSPWNKNARLPKDIIRVNSWAEVVNYLQ